MLSIFRRLMKNAQGATAIEYTLIASLIAVAAIASMRTVGGKGHQRADQCVERDDLKTFLPIERS